VGFKGVRVGSVAVLIDVDDALTGRLRRQWHGRAAKAVAPGNIRALEDRTRGSRSPEATLRDRVAGIQWYHTIDLGDGIVTPGAFDHRPHLHHFLLPRRLDGLRVLDVATFDGFWAFEFERRGAAAVVAIDLDRYGDVDLAPRVRSRLSHEELDKPLGSGFALAREVLGSKVQREALNVYELSPERLGTFDLVFCSDLLLHLKNPIKALENIRSVTRGRAVIVDTFHPVLPQKTIKYIGGAETSVWWLFSLGALEQMISDAGFDTVALASRFQMQYEDGKPLWQAVFSATP
jgi:tRNA (mo5U34)-methyltransferase